MIIGAATPAAIAIAPTPGASAAAVVAAARSDEAEGGRYEVACNAGLWRADSARCRPSFRDDLAHHSDLKSPTRSETISPGIPG